MEKVSQRSQNFTDEECALMFEFLEEKGDLLKSKFNNVITNAKKIKMWEELTKRVNALGHGKRTAEQIKRKWKNLISSAKREMGGFRSSQTKTGGGPPPKAKEPTLMSQLIWDLNKDCPSFKGLTGIETEHGNYPSFMTHNNKKINLFGMFSLCFTCFKKRRSYSHIPLLPGT